MANPTDVSKISESSPSRLKFGFIGMGDMGSGIVKNVMSSGHTMKCYQIEDDNATYALTDVVSESDIIFSCISNAQVSKDWLNGILAAIKRGKSYVEMSSIDPKTSYDISKAVTEKKGRYMEAMIQGSITEAESGNLVIIAAGNKKLFDDCKSVFCAIAKNSRYVGKNGSATTMNLVLNTIKAVSITGLAEAMDLANKGGIPRSDVMDIFKFTSLNCQLLLEEGKAMMDENLKKVHSLKHVQKDLRLLINLSDSITTPCPVSATVNEVLKNAILRGYSDHDISKVSLSENNIKK